MYAFFDFDIRDFYIHSTNVLWFPTVEMKLIPSRLALISLFPREVLSYVG